MPHDPVLLADTRAWMEKALKAFLAWHESPFRKTHDLRELFSSCCLADPSLASLGERAEGLTPYAWVFRYPGEAEEPARGDAEQALGLARDVYAAILARLPESARP